MKHNNYLYILLILFLASSMSVNAQIVKEINVGRINARVLDHGHQGETLSGKNTNDGVIKYYFDGNNGVDREFFSWLLRDAGTQIGVRNWTDTTGTLNPYMMAGAEHGTGSLLIQFAVPDEVGNTIKKYMRRPLPSVTVDGIPVQKPFPYDDMDEVNASKIPGTADVMIESNIRTWIGLSLRQRVLGWSSPNHDNYVIYDLVYKNTGNVDLDPQVDIPNNILDSMYIMRGNGWQVGSRQKEWVSWVGARTSDPLRMIYTYPMRKNTGTLDDFGAPRDADNQPRIYGPHYGGEALLFISNAPNKTNILTDDDQMQPIMHSCADYRTPAIKDNPLWSTSAGMMPLTYETLKRGAGPARPDAGEIPFMTGADLKPGFHEVPPDERGYKYINDIPGWGGGGDGKGGYHEYPTYSVGPFKLAPGDSIRIVYALVVGTISKRKSFELGRAFYGKNANYPAPEGCEWDDAAGKPIKDNLPQPYQLYPDLWTDANYGNKVSWIKDCWVATGKDSLFKYANAAKWAVSQSYNIPTPPPAPSVDVQGRGDAIRIAWGNESESASDFAGYRVYRAIGNYKDSAWIPIFECTKSNLVHQFDDITAVRGTAYYYYVAAFNDGSKADFEGKKVQLESNMFSNRTTLPAQLARPYSTDLDKIRVVPNPFSLEAAENKLQFTGQNDKIMFYNLPPECTIRIFTESGDLIRTIEHTSGTGDESWGHKNIINDHQATSDGQRPVSGLYIANIVTPDGQTKNVKFLIVR